jgi:hypothetical protein
MKKCSKHNHCSNQLQIMKETELHDKSIREHFLSSTLKQYSKGFSNFLGCLPVYSQANHEYLKRLTNFVEE